MHDHGEHDDPRESDLLKALIYREVDHHDGPQAEAIHKVRQTISLALGIINDALHDARPMHAGDQWTIPIGMSCGFEAELVIRVKDPGPDHGRE